MYLNLVLECMPETLYAATRFYAKQKQSMPMIYVKVRLHLPPRLPNFLDDMTLTLPPLDRYYVQTYIYQLMRALAYIHTLGICRMWSLCLSASPCLA